ncbi:MAG TPA: hypothetical protein VNV39_23280 [Stellaceae bacterium]|jgi:hypothetical protein|nr:hypothetical protein [Stellaceae bacterium]
MAAASPDQGGVLAPYRVVADMGISTGFEGTIRASDRIPSEELTAIRADVHIQLEWLDAIEAALRELRRRHIEDPALVEAAVIAEQLRAAISSPEALAKSPKALWACLYGCISAPFLLHFSSAVGDDLGHATAHKIVEILSILTRYLNL